MSISCAVCMCVQVTGCRDGKVIAWDTETCAAVAKLEGHKGHITAVAQYSGDDCSVFLSGAQARCGGAALNRCDVGHVRRRRVARLVCMLVAAGWSRASVGYQGSA